MVNGKEQIVAVAEVPVDRLAREARPFGHVLHGHAVAAERRAARDPRREDAVTRARVRPGGEVPDRTFRLPAAVGHPRHRWPLLVGAIPGGASLASSPVSYYTDSPLSVTPR